MPSVALLNPTRASGEPALVGKYRPGPPRCLLDATPPIASTTLSRMLSGSSAISAAWIDQRWNRTNGRVTPSSAVSSEYARQPIGSTSARAVPRVQVTRERREVRISDLRHPVSVVTGHWGPAFPDSLAWTDGWVGFTPSTDGLPSRLSLRNTLRRQIGVGALRRGRAYLCLQCATNNSEKTRLARRAGKTVAHLCREARPVVVFLPEIRRTCSNHANPQFAASGDGIPA